MCTSFSDNSYIEGTFVALSSEINFPHKEQSVTVSGSANTQTLDILQLFKANVLKAKEAKSKDKKLKNSEFHYD